MYYRANNELIVRDPQNNRAWTQSSSPFGNTESVFVNRETKKNMWGKLNFYLRGEILKNDLDTRVKDRHCHIVNESFNYCPMILNYIASRGFQKVLFVGNFNAAQRSWPVSRKQSSLFSTPTYHADADTMIDPSVWLQFLPIVHASYGYTFSLHTIVPPESKHRGLVHAIYRRYGLDLLPCTKQYAFGRRFEMTPLTAHKYDCVVFAGIQNNVPDAPFTMELIEDEFRPYMTGHFTMIDLNYADPDPNRFSNSITRPNSPTLHEIFSLRGVWDETFRNADASDRQIEYKTMDNIITEFHNPSSVFQHRGASRWEEEMHQKL